MSTASRFAPFVRLEVEAAMPSELVALLTHELNLEAAQNVLRVDCLLSLADLAKLPVRCRSLWPGNPQFGDRDRCCRFAVRQSLAPPPPPPQSAWCAGPHPI